MGNNNDTNGVFVPVITFIVVLALVLFLDFTGMAWDSYMAPKREEIRTRTFEKGRAFKEGKRQELIRYRYQWTTAKDKNSKSAICSTVRMSFADVNTEGMNPELKSFLSTCLNPQF